MTFDPRMTSEQFRKLQKPRQKRKKPLNNEEKLHIGVKDMLDRDLPEGIAYLHIPNAPRSQAAGAKLKKMGMRRGAPDLLFIRRRDDFSLAEVMAIELKTDKEEHGAKGYLSQAQKDWRDEFTAMHGKYAVCRTKDEVRQALIEWGVELY